MHSCKNFALSFRHGGEMKLEKEEAPSEGRGDSVFALFSLSSSGVLTGKERDTYRGGLVLLSTSAESLPVCPWSKT